MTPLIRFDNLEFSPRDMCEICRSLKFRGSSVIMLFKTLALRISKRVKIEVIFESRLRAPKSSLGVFWIDPGATKTLAKNPTINYRNNGDIGGLLGYSFQERYEIGYVYEMVNSELKTYAPVSHEFMIAIKFKPATEEELLFYK